MRLTLFIALLSLSANADTSYYVDPSRSSNGDGSEANPWKAWGNINWSTVGASLAGGNVSIYFSSRSVSGTTFAPGIHGGTGTGTLLANSSPNAPVSGANNMLSFYGDQKFNTNATGTAVWSAESLGNRHTISNVSSTIQLGGSGGWSNMWFQGFALTNFGYSVSMGESNPTTNCYNLAIVNCALMYPSNNHGVWFGYMETNCHDILIRSNLIYGSKLEGIYSGHFNYLQDTMTNVVIEYNTLVDCGEGTTTAQGDIDIKPGCYGAIVRYNIHSNSIPFVQGGNCGVVVAANACQIYGNRFINARNEGDATWGIGIYVNSEGDGAGNGKAIDSCLIYNNVVAGSVHGGIRFVATTSTSGADISGVKLWNNTIVSNLTYGVYLSASGSRTITIAELYNNLFQGNDTNLLTWSSAATITAADYNLYCGATGTNWMVSGIGKNWSQWQSLGYDAHGLTNAPLLNADYTLSATSPAIGAGKNLVADFTTDLNGATRTRWDIGAFLFPATGPQTLNVSGSARVGTLRSAQ